MLNTCFPPGSPNLWYTLGRGCLCDRRGTESPTSFPVGQELPCTVRLLLGELRPPCVSGGGLLEACTGFPQTSPHVPFPFIDVALYSFPVISHGHEQDYMLSPWVLLVNHQILGWSWGSPPPHNTKMSSFNIICGRKGE